MTTVLASLIGSMGYMSAKLASLIGCLYRAIVLQSAELILLLVAKKGNVMSMYSVSFSYWLPRTMELQSA